VPDPADVDPTDVDPTDADPGSQQSWATKVIHVVGEAHDQVTAVKAGEPVTPVSTHSHQRGLPILPRSRGSMAPWT